MNNITIRPLIKEDVDVLLNLSYENTYDKMFSLSYDGNTFSLSEVELPVPQTNISSNYKGLTTDVIPHLNDQDFIALVVCIDEKPVGWTFAHWKVRDAGKVLTIGGILVATEAHRKGCAKSLLHELLSIAQNTSDCVGVWIEMDTTKYQAVKLLQATGFVFAGTELYVWQNALPTKYSKEVLYFYYPINR